MVDIANGGGRKRCFPLPCPAGGGYIPFVAGGPWHGRSERAKDDHVVGRSALQPRAGPCSVVDLAWLTV